MSITGVRVRAGELLAGGRVLVCDGAMGTMLHAAGAALDRSLPELNLSDPELVSTIHDSYLSAGADIIQANTFGANRLWLGDHGFPDKVDEINRAGVRLARAAAAQAGRPVLVAGSVSPAVTGLQRRRVGSAERAEVLREQLAALVAEGTDLLILETFGYLDELVEAVSVAASLTGVPLIAQATFADDAHTLGGETPREVASVLSALPVAAIGTNCTVGPQRMLAVAEDLVRYSSVPVSAQPNAGQPRRVGARTFEFSIEGGYFARYLGRFAAAGVTIVGGCCGTTPTHIRAAVEAVQTAAAAAAAARPGRAASPADPVFATDRASAGQGGPAETGAGETGAGETGAGEAAGAGALAELLAARKFVVAAAITPPASGWAGEAEEAAAVLQDHGVGLVAVQPRENARTHMDSLNMALQIQQRVGVETIATVTTWDKSIMSLQADLLGAHALGIRSVVATTGSPVVVGDYPAVDGTWEVDSLGLAGLLAGLNAGRDSNGLALTSRTSFCIGARVNPGARDLEAEIARTRAKIRAGAQFLVSRPVYEPDSLRALVSALDGTGVPLLLSVTVLRSFEEADYLANEVPGVTIPAGVLESLEKAGRGGARPTGITLASGLLAQVRPLVNGVILTVPDDDATAVLPLIDALG
ncbi:MAG TPA: bifunctional homocysteine S-methyltransferase/methylenetetrahydrofolate reductase [Trebonia sp.]|nr:bifunctional homocysteine S-methyltransferase/methylenetetrahydrofolate reductase [Trebonia sp.]